MLDIGSSRELCGGTDVQRTGDIGLFKVVAESGAAAGVRRIEAVTGDNALSYLKGLEATVQQLAGSLKAAPAEVPARLGATAGAAAPGREGEWPPPGQAGLGPG